MKYKVMMKAAAIGMSLLMLGACGKKNDNNTSEQSRQQQERELIEDAQNDGSMQEGAEVTTGRDSNGNASFQYTNPDGSGGGGVVLD